MHNLDLSLADISKIEGKASCDVKIREGKVIDVKFSIAEFKRFYTKAIRGKDVAAIPQLTARICGTCSNAHLLCAVQAVEDAVGMIPTPQTILLRQLLNFGLIIRDHALHLYVFVLPDLFGKDSILDFDENNQVEHKYLDDAFAVKAAGNNLSKAVGGRAVHAPFAAVGGFLKMPSQADLDKSHIELMEIRQTVVDCIKLFAEKDAQLPMKGLTYAAVLDKGYTFLSGDLIRTDGSAVSYKQYGEFLTKTDDMPHSQATAYAFDGKRYMVGALARLNLAKIHLHPKTRQTAAKYLNLFPSDDIHRNNLAQAIEILHAVDSSIEILKNLKITDEKPIPIQKKEGIGFGVIEAPRGTLYYKLTVNAEGKVADGQIVVPTGQNQRTIEASIKQYLETHLEELKTEDEVAHQIERIVRAFDPCMSCASHFLKLRLSGWQAPVSA